MDTARENYSFNDIINKKTPIEFADYLAENFIVQIPEKIETPDDFHIAGQTQLQIGNKLQFLCELEAYAKIYVRMARREGDKTKIDDAIDKQAAVGAFVDGLSKAQKTLSRATTVYIDEVEFTRMGI